MIKAHRDMNSLYIASDFGLPPDFCWALCILWIGVMDWSHGVEPWSEMMVRQRTIYSGGKFGLSRLNRRHSETCSKGINRISKKKNKWLIFVTYPLSCSLCICDYLLYIL